MSTHSKNRPSPLPSHGAPTQVGHAGTRLRRARGRAAEEGHSAAEQPALSQARDTGLALVLLLLLAAQIGGRYALLPLAIGLLVLSMLWPALFRLPARLWFG